MIPEAVVREQALRIIQAWLDAWNHNDPDNLMSLYEPGADLIAGDGTHLKGPEEIRAACAGSSRSPRRVAPERCDSRKCSCSRRRGLSGRRRLEGLLTRLVGIGGRGAWHVCSATHGR